MILIDSSVWIDYLRDVDSPAVTKLWNLLSDDSKVATTGVIVGEVLSGQKSERLYKGMLRDMEGLISLPADDPTDYIAAAEIYRNCRAKGLTVRGLTDCLIAAIAIRTGATLLHSDRDFETIEKANPRLKLWDR